MKSLKTLFAAAAVATIGFASASFAGDTNKQVAAATQGDIVDVAASTGQFNTLIAAAKAAGLVEVLKSKGPLTIFAPTDAAFKKLPAGTVETLLKPENKAKLAAILKHHVIVGKVMSSDIAGKKLEAKTANGDMLAIDATDGVMVGGAKVIKADVPASNGVIHIVDTVILPKM